MSTQLVNTMSWAWTNGSCGSPHYTMRIRYFPHSAARGDTYNAYYEVFDPRTGEVYGGKFTASEKAFRHAESFGPAPVSNDPH